MKKILLLALCAAIIAIFLSGCVSVNFGYPIGFGGSGPGVAGRGASESYTFNTGSITEIRMSMYCDVELYTTPSDTVTLEVQPNLLEYIVVEESGGILTVRSTGNIVWSSGNAPILTVGTASLSSVNFAGAGSLTAHDTITGDSFSLDFSGAGVVTAELDVEHLSVGVSGAGDIRLSGTADTADFSLAGAGRVEALSLQTRESDVKLAGAATLKVACSERLKVNAGGVGTVEYRGSPSVDITRGGMVSIRQVS